MGLHFGLPQSCPSLPIPSGTFLLGPMGASQCQDAAGPNRAFVLISRRWQMQPGARGWDGEQSAFSSPRLDALDRDPTCTNATGLPRVPASVAALRTASLTHGTQAPAPNHCALPDGSVATRGFQGSIRKGTGRGCSFSAEQLGAIFMSTCLFSALLCVAHPVPTLSPRTCHLQPPSLFCCVLRMLNTQHLQAIRVPASPPPTILAAHPLAPAVPTTAPLGSFSPGAHPATLNLQLDDLRREFQTRG